MLNDKPTLGPHYEQLKDGVRQADFERLPITGILEGHFDGLDLSKVDLEDFSTLRIKSLVLLAEVHDYRGAFLDAAKWAAPGARVFPQLSYAAKSLGRNERAQAFVRLAVAYARCLYRTYDLIAAEHLLLECRQYVAHRLATEEFPCFGTLGEIAYLLGRVYRQEERFIGARREFEMATQFYEDRALRKRQRGEQDWRQDARFSEHKIATILGLGIGWCNYTLGALSTAMRANLIPARNLLRKSGDVLNTAYADVIYASALRAAFGSKSTRLIEARNLVAGALEIFEQHGHEHYASGARLELALIRLAGGTHDPETVLPTGLSDPRWQVSAHIIRSRLAKRQGQPKQARFHAEEALRLAGDMRHGRIEAYIARSEAVVLEDRARAISDLRQALSLNQLSEDGIPSLNPKTHATCHLHLTRIYLDSQSFDDARASFAEWEKVRNQVEHARLQATALKLEGELLRAGKMGFTVDGLNWRTNQRALKCHLLKRAELTAHSDRGIAKLLGITPGQVPTWRDACENAKSTKRVRKSHTKR